ncbi:hypothetical protein [Methylocella sp.]|uniref:hypothetical protein n=1 Tax=Methylocella sp. TaxID=1978226 RepID=UPI0037838A89
MLTLLGGRFSLLGGRFFRAGRFHFWLKAGIEMSIGDRADAAVSDRKSHLIGGKEPPKDALDPIEPNAVGTRSI